MIDDLTHGIDSQADKIIKELQGQKVKDAKMLLKTINFEMNPTKESSPMCWKKSWLPLSTSKNYYLKPILLTADVL